MSKSKRLFEFSTGMIDEEFKPVPFKGRGQAVKEANELTELSGQRVYVQPKGASFTVSSPTNNNR